jgi:DNA-binding transcriptional MocR family regulator
MVAGRLASSLLEGAFKSGERLPPERELMEMLGVSRATLREGLKALAESGLITAQPGVGWFAGIIDRSNWLRLVELAQPTGRPIRRPWHRLPGSCGPTGFRSSPEALRIPNLQTDRLGTFDLISGGKETRSRRPGPVVGAGGWGMMVVKKPGLMGSGISW